MRFVHGSWAGLRRACVPTRTGSNLQYSQFRRNLIAPVDLLVRRRSARCARRVAIYRRNHDVTAPARVFQHVEYLPASSARRNKAQEAQPTQLVVTSTQPLHPSGRVNAF